MASRGAHFPGCGDKKYASMEDIYNCPSVVCAYDGTLCRLAHKTQWAARVPNSFLGVQDLAPDGKALATQLVSSSTDREPSRQVPSMQYSVHRYLGMGALANSSHDESGKQMCTPNCKLVRIQTQSKVHAKDKKIL